MMEFYFLAFFNEGFVFFKINRVYMRYGNECRKVCGFFFFFNSSKISIT